MTDPYEEYLDIFRIPETLEEKMTEQTQTEKLREKIGELLAKNAGFFDTRGWSALPQSVQKVCGEEADQILQACKEAGLGWIAFTDDNPELWSFEEIELDNAP